MSKTKDAIIDDLNKEGDKHKDLFMKNREFTIRDRDFMAIIHEMSPQGAEYANKAMNKAFELNEVSIGFYPGSLLNDYGLYPFLNACSAEYEENDLYSMQIIFRSELDKETLEEWINSLSLSKKEKMFIISDVRQYYKLSSGKLDTCYLDVLTYLIQVLKCFKERYREKKEFADALFGLDKDYSHVVTFNSVITKDYLKKRISRYNKKNEKKSGKHFIMYSYPGLENGACIVSCVPYKRKCHE